MLLLAQLVLGKFGLVWFEALFAKPETKPFGFSQIFRNRNRNRIKPFDAVSNGFNPSLNQNRWWAPKSSGGGAARFLHLRRHDAISVHSANNRLTEASWPDQAEVTQIGRGSSRGPADDFLSFWDPSWPPLMKPRSRLRSSGSVRVRRGISYRNLAILGNIKRLATSYQPPVSLGT